MSCAGRTCSGRPASIGCCRRCSACRSRPIIITSSFSMPMAASCRNRRSRRACANCAPAARAARYPAHGRAWALKSWTLGVWTLKLRNCAVKIAAALVLFCRPPWHGGRRRGLRWRDRGPNKKPPRSAARRGRARKPRRRDGSRARTRLCWPYSPTTSAPRSPVSWRSANCWRAPISANASGAGPPASKAAPSISPR